MKKRKEMKAQERKRKLKEKKVKKWNKTIGTQTKGKEKQQEMKRNDRIGKEIRELSLYE